MQVQTLCTRSVPIAVPMRRRDDWTVARLIDGYDIRGGLATTDELVLMMRPHWRQPISMLAKWIIGRRVVSFSWREQLLLPLFQFTRPRMVPIEVVSDSVFELAECLQDQAVATWFIDPNEALGQERPIDRLPSDAVAVVEAARRTRRLVADRRARVN